MKGATAIGVALAAAHVVALPLVLAHCRRDALAVEVRGDRVSPTFTLDGDLPASLRPRVVDEIDAPGPGLGRRTWTVRYRGGYQRSVGAAQLVGPLQDPAAPPCTARVIVGQRFLDDGHAGPGTIAGEIKRIVGEQLAGLDQFPVGRFQKIARTRVRWARFDDPGTELWTRLQAVTAGPEVTGYVRAELDLAFSRAHVPVTVTLIPRLRGDQLSLLMSAHAKLDLDSRVLDWLADKLGGDAFVSELATEQLDGAMLDVLGPPPPLPLPGGRSLRLAYCKGAPLEVASGAWAALPLALIITGPTQQILPPRLGALTRPPPRADVPVTLDLDLDAVNGVLYELWRTGFLDEQLDVADLHRRFNEDPTVTELLSVRLSPLRLALPPVLTARADGGLELRGELEMNLGDGDVITHGRAWTALRLGLRGDGTQIVADVGLAELALTCEPRPGHLEPCYGDLVAALRDRAPEIDGELGAILTHVLTELVIGQRFGQQGAPMELAVTGATATVHPIAPNAVLRVELNGALESAASDP